MSGVALGGNKPVILLREATAANILFASWVELDAVLSHEVRGITVMSSLDRDIRLGVGEAGSEVDYLFIAAGDTLPQTLDHASQITLGQRLSVRAFVSDATAGTLNITLWS